MVVLDAGDFLFGTPFHTFYGGRAEIECMNAVGYDAVAVGNHELDRGPKALLDLANLADFPLMSANLIWRRNGEQVFQPYMFLEAEDITIALLAITTGNVHARVRPSSVVPLASGSPIETARRFVPMLCREAQAVIVLSHIGIDEDKKLAREVPGIDLIIGGDSHTLLKDPVKMENPRSARPTYIVQAGSHGYYLGRVDMSFMRGVLSGIETLMIPVRSVIREDPLLKKIVGKYWTSMEKSVTRVVAQATGPYPRDPTLREGESPLGNLIADITRHATGADFAIQNAGGVRAGFEEGPITVWDVYRALPYDNRLLTLEMSGEQVGELANDISRRLGRSSFCQVSGMSFTIGSGRALDILVAGEPLDADRTYKLGVIDYLSEGGDHYEILTKAKVLSSSGRFQRDIAVEYLREVKTVHPRTEDRIRVAS